MLVDRSLPGTLARRLYENVGRTRALELDLSLSNRVPLKDQELSNYLRKQEMDRQKREEEERLRQAQRDLEDAQDVEEGQEELVAMDTTELAECAHFQVRERRDACNSNNGGLQNRHDVLVSKESEMPMFPLMQQGGGEWSPYGLALDEQAFQEAAPSEPQPMDLGPEEREVPQQPPSKIQYMHIPKFRVESQLRYVDMEGLSDGTSMQNLLKIIQPRSVVFVRGSDPCLDQMKRFVTGPEMNLKRVHAPDVGQTVDASSDETVYTGWLDAGLRANLEWQIVDDVEVAWLSSHVSDVQRATTGHERRVLARDDESTEETHSTLFLGQPALKDIKVWIARFLPSSSHLTPFFSLSRLHWTSEVIVQSFSLVCCSSTTASLCAKIPLLLNSEWKVPSLRTTIPSEISATVNSNDSD